MNVERERYQAIQKLAELIQGIPVAMLTTRDESGQLHSRPMVNINHNFEGDLWFFTHEDDPKVKEIEQDPQVNVAFAAPERERYVSVAGTASLVHDQKRRELLWDDHCKPWFPDGLDEKQLALLRIDVDTAAYWDSHQGMMVALKRLVLGKKGVDTQQLGWKDRPQTSREPG